jgi:hypothetical protein
MLTATLYTISENSHWLTNTSDFGKGMNILKYGGSMQFRTCHVYSRKLKFSLGDGCH